MDKEIAELLRGLAKDNLSKELADVVEKLKGIDDAIKALKEKIKLQTLERDKKTLRRIIKEQRKLAKDLVKRQSGRIQSVLRKMARLGQISSKAFGGTIAQGALKLAGNSLVFFDVLLYAPIYERTIFYDVYEFEQAFLRTEARGDEIVCFIVAIYKHTKSGLSYDNQTKERPVNFRGKRPRIIKLRRYPCDKPPTMDLKSLFRPSLYVIVEQ